METTKIYEFVFDELDLVSGVGVVDSFDPETGGLRSTKYSLLKRKQDDGGFYWECVKRK